MPSNRFFVTAICVLAVVGQIIYLAARRQDGTVDFRSLIEPGSSAELAPDSPVIPDDVVADRDPSDQEPSQKNRVDVDASDLGSLPADGPDGSDDQRETTPSGDMAQPSPAESQALSNAPRYTATTGQSSVGIGGNQTQERSANPDSVRIVAGRSAVRILDERGNWAGSGVVIRSTAGEFWVLTASHVLKDLPVFSVEVYAGSGNADNRRYTRVERRHSDAAQDLAVLTVIHATEPETLMVTATLPSRSDRSADDRRSVPPMAWTVDCSNPTSAKVALVDSIGWQQARRTPDADLLGYWRILPKSRPGMSGSGLFDGDGHLIGIASGNSRNGSFYCDSVELSRFLSELDLPLRSDRGP
ncbi:S1 family peptidase [Crateriforma spongiae]|uniref:S1 family peptidase n=1 Tax=Crateriforma spongiae TaxID=2724528 RepID=UPI0039AEC485